MSAKALVTGGSGFIGGRLIESLVADGHGVRALARSRSSADSVAALGAEPVRGELGDPGSSSATTSRAPETSPRRAWRPASADWST